MFLRETPNRPTIPSPAEAPRARVTPSLRVTTSTRKSPVSTPREMPSPHARRPDETAFSTPARLPGPESVRVAGLSRPLDSSSAASWREYAERALRSRAYAEASLAFAEEARIYRRKGHAQAARAEELKAARYRTEIELYTWRPAEEVSAGLSRLEPATGCMVGAFIDRDEAVGRLNFGWQRFGDVEDFNEFTGKRHASFFTYLSFKNRFPADWAAYLRQHQAIPHLAWEPGDLSEVTDAALAEFVQALKSYGGPVILRFASEMNGEWTRYHSNPALYRATFRRVYQATRAVNGAAMLWCPNAVPADKIAQYYPGDDACDWVGVNFYSVPFLDNNPSRPGHWIHPVDFLEPVYRAYASKKPIAIGEYAASHASASVPGLKTDFARLKIAQLYQSLPLRYPRVKLVSWYDCNNLEKARADRKLNNFQLTDQPDVLREYQHWVQSPYFLGAGQSSAPRQAEPFPDRLVGRVQLEPWVRSYEANPRVFFRLDGKLLAEWQLPKGGQPWLPALPPGAHKLELLVYDSQNRLAGRRTFPFQVE